MMKYLNWMKENDFSILVASPADVEPTKELKSVLPSPLSNLPPKVEMNAVIAGRTKTMRVEALNMNKIEDWFLLNLGSEQHLRNFHATVILTQDGSVDSIYEFGEYNGQHSEWMQSFAKTSNGYHFVDSKWLRMFMDSSLIKDEFFDLIVRSSVEN